MPTNTPRWNRGSHYPPLAGLAGMYKIYSPEFQDRCVDPFAHMACAAVSFPSLPHVTPCSSCTQQSPQASKVSLRRARFSSPMRCSSAAFCVLAGPATSPTARSMIPCGQDVSFPSWRACSLSLANASIAGSLSFMSVQAGQ